MAKKSNFHKNIELFAVLIAFIFWGAIGAFGLLNKFEYKIYDELLGIAKQPAESEKIFLVDIDDQALNKMGPWPWSRDVIADQLLLMREMGAETVVFDIEYLSSSQKTINQQLLNEIMENPEKADELKYIYRDNDDYFAKTIQFFGNTWLTINTGNLGISYTPEELEYARKRFLYKTTDNRKNKDILPYTDFSPAAFKFISHASGAGFTNVEVDSDGSRRRIKLFENYEDGAVAQLAVAPLLSMLEPEEIIQNDRSVILRNAKLPGKDERKDIKIPLDKDGNMLIHWLKKDFTANDENGNLIPEETSFQQNSIYWLWCMTSFEQQVASNLNELQKLNEFNFTDENGKPLSFISACKSLKADYSDISDYREYLLSGCDGFSIDSASLTPQDTDAFLQYFELRQYFFNNVIQLMNSGLIDELGEYLNEHFTDFTDEQLAEISAAFTAADELKENAENYVLLFDLQKDMYKGKFCIVGNTGTSTTDLGTTPFNVRYPNVGTHANVINTILQEDFIYPVDWYWSVIFAAVLSLIFLYVCKKSKIWVQNLVGIALTIIMIVIPALSIHLWGIYIPCLSAVLITLTSYVIVTVSKFVSSEKDKAFLQGTFSAYVAPAVVEQIVKDPSIAKLGGKSDTLTALFSDVKTFSRFTEVVNNENGEEHGAEKLVATLNGYLGALSDAIMDNHGTIDKYVGDEIVSFFGAPIHDENNAYQACVAAIRMREAEEKYNTEHEAELPVNPATGKPYYLHSRIGLNTGNMVVGNMGTEKKLNYTIMGNNVNLASRLEGTNNAYGSWIMCSESTWNAANSGDNKGKIIAREFDYVRVINVKKPVRIYGIIGLKDEINSTRLKAAETFNEGMKHYLKGADTPEVKKDIEDLRKAEELFREADRLYPDDESSKVFIRRCEQFLKEGLPEKWDGVFEMKTK